MQGLAALDPAKEQARIIFGGGSGGLQLALTGFAAAPYFENQVHAVVWETAYTGFAPTAGPRAILEGDFPIVNGQVTIDLENLIEYSAYQMVLSPASEGLSTQSTNWYPAEYTARPMTVPPAS